MKKTLSLLFSLLLLLSCFSIPAFAEEEGEEFDPSKLDQAYYTRFKGQNVSINVYNWGEYIDNEEFDTNAQFEKVTGIKVNYTTFASNEELFARLKSGGVHYDIIIPSDYMVARLEEHGLLEELNLSNIPNFKHIDKNFINPIYDPENKFSVPYTWGVVGILYNEKQVDEIPDSWDYLWSEKYKGKILMFDNSRDAFGIALTKLGYSQNSTDLGELSDASKELIKQKDVLQAYVMDQIFDKMGSGEAALAPYYAGDSLLISEINPDVKFVVPKEGTNRFIDAMCIPKGAQNKEAAEMYINFLNEPEVAAANIDYIGYSSPNEAAIELLDEDTKNNPVIYPSEEILKNTETFVNLPEETNSQIDYLWTEVKGSGATGQGSLFLPIMLVLGIVLSIIVNIHNARKRKREKML